MRVLITGGTGLIGRAVSVDLQAAGYDVIVLTRDPSRAKPPAGVDVAGWDGLTGAGWSQLLDRESAILHLAGEGIAEGRWSEERKRRLRASRVDSGRAVLEGIRAAKITPRVLLQSSAVGFYGPRGDDPLDENEPAGSTFLADVSREWEASTRDAEKLGVRRPLLRTGIVLSRDGGALPKMSLPVRLGVGGALGSGKQWFPWIHEVDEVAAIRFLLERNDATGPFNLTAPNPVTNAEFTRALGRALHRPTLFRVPAFALRIAVGEMADSLLASQRVIPKRLLDLGFRFRFEGVDAALAELFSNRAAA